MEKSTIQVENLGRRFVQGDQTIDIFDEVNVTFTQGQTYAVTGPSGMGKSTFMQLIAGIDEPTTGKILFDGRDINALPSLERAGLLNTFVGLVFQQPHLIRELSVLENVYLPGLIGNKPLKECREQAQKLLKQVDLSHKAESRPASLSGGQQQRVALARALFNRPAFLLADEPTGSLDIKTGEIIVDLMFECQKTWGMGIVVSTHDDYVADRMALIYRFTGEGSMKQIER